MKKYRIVTLGCRTNQYESAAYATQLEALGYVRAQENEPADLCVVNSCTVTATADRDSRKILKKLARENPGARIAATGCMVEGGNVEFATDVIPNQEKEQLVQRLFPEEKCPEFKINQFPAHTRAFVKVQDGCNSFCTYCIIPYVRGRSRSRPKDEILREIEGLVERGFKEIVLTGINIGDFEPSLAELIREVDEIEGVERIRVSSIDPDEVDEDLASAILEGKKTCPSMHIVLQAGSNVVLKRMNRKYTRQHFFDTVERLRGANPDFTFTTDVIVGFPGETDRDFEETLEVIDQVRFAKVHMFPYSVRERTRAALYLGRIQKDVMQARKMRILAHAESSAYTLREEFVGRRMKVLIESDGRGHTENFLPVEVEGRPNEIVEVELIKNTPTGLVGQCFDGTCSPLSSPGACEAYSSFNAQSSPIAQAMGSSFALKSKQPARRSRER